MEILQATELSYTKIQSLNFNRTLCFLPVSALEVHGPHLPLGMDCFLARWMAEETGQRFATEHPDWTVVQYPVLSLGTDELPLKGSMNASQRTVYNAVTAHASALAQAGYRYIVITNGHGGPRHVAALEYACHRISKSYKISMFTPSILVLHRILKGQRQQAIESLMGRELTQKEKLGLLSGEHAGSWETSFMLAERPELVEANYLKLPLLRPPVFKPLASLSNGLAWLGDRWGHDVSKGKEILQHLSSVVGWLLNVRYGYGAPPVVSYQGDPSVASAEIGKAFREVLAQDCLAIVNSVVAGKTQALDVRSLASDFALIQPNFWRWLGLATAVLLALFLIWAMQ